MEVADQQAAVRVDTSGLAALALATLIDHRVLRGELSLSFVDEATMADLNERYLDIDGPTDVLAFPLDLPSDLPSGAEPSPPDEPEPDEPEEPEEKDGEMPVLLGDVAVCPAVAERNAAARAVPTDDELALLVVHGVLHVLGLDHAEPDEAAEMRAAERRLLARWHHVR